MSSPTFQGSTHYSPTKVRGANRRIEASHAATGRPASPDLLAMAQHEVWSEIASYGRKLGVGSATGDLDEITSARSEDLNAWVADFPAVPGQVGILAFVGREPLGLDSIGDREIYARVHPRLVGAYALDALTAGDRGEAPDPEAAETVLARVGTAARIKAPTVGRGIYRVLSGDVVGGELEDGGKLVHLSAFPAR